MKFIVFISFLSFSLFASNNSSETDRLRQAMQKREVLIMKLENKNLMFQGSKPSPALEHFIQHFVPIFSKVQRNYTTIDIYSSDIKNDVAKKLKAEFIKYNFKKAKIKLASKDLQIEHSIKKNNILLIFTKVRNYNQLRDFLIRQVKAYKPIPNTTLSTEILSSELPVL